MDFGLFYEICVPRPWDPGKEAQIIRETVEQVRYAEEMGFKYVWLTEHHFLQEYSHCSAPEVLLGAFSQVTSEMRLGHGVVLTPPQYNHPVRIAERAAMIDCLSEGRLELGTGRSATPVELNGFEIDASNSREMWREGIESVVRLLTEEDVELHGEYVSMPKRTVLPRCVQQPHPPLWLAGTSPTTCEQAAEAGMGVLFFAVGLPPPELAPSIESYRSTVISVDPIGKVANNKLAGFVNGLCGENDAETKAIGGQAGLDYLTLGLQYCLWPSDVPPPRTFEYAATLPQKREELLALGPDGMIREHLIMAGNPDSCNELVSAYADLGLDQLIVHMQTWGISHERIMESIRLMGTHIIPEYADRPSTATAAPGRSS
jgi:alkanesulfonate monooxygenase SsuD/methylene tetrahydromethanopterin reductase-like flavin-dependent oxidoreductase (luciferase family)